MKWLLVVGLCVATVAQAQVTVSKGFAKRSFAVTGFTGDATVAGQVAEVLKNDVKLSGWLGLAPSETAEFVQRGAVRRDSGGVTVECIVTQRMTQKVVLSKAYPGSPQDLRRLAHKISDEIVQAITGERGIAQTKIAFILTRGKVKELAVMDYDGHNVRQLSSDKKISVHPRWSPDGRKIIYTGYLRVFPDVVEADIVTHQRRAIATYRGLNSGAVYSPDGSAIALTLSKDGNPELYVMNTGGGGLRRLTRTTGSESSPAWSPDSQQIAYVSDDRGNPQLYVINRNGGEPTRLTFPPSSPSYNTEPAWSNPPAGSQIQPRIALTSRVGGKFAIGLYDSGTREVRMVTTDGADSQNPSWAPNGRHLVFEKLRNWHSRLYLLDVETGEQVELPAVDGEMSEPAWGP